MSRSLVRREGRGPALHSRSRWNEQRQEILLECGHRIAALELEGAVFFGSADGLEDRVYGLMRDGVTHIVLDMKRITDIDSTGGLTLQRIGRRLNDIGGELAISYVLKERRKTTLPVAAERRAGDVPRHVWAALENSGALVALGEDIFFPDTDSALTHLENRVMAEYTGGRRASGKSPAHGPPILRGLKSHELRAIRGMATRHEFPKGEVIFRQGDAGDALYYLARGRVDILVHLSDAGIDKRLQSLAEGSIFGEMALLDDKPRAASVVAAEDSICYRLDVRKFEQIKESHPEAAPKLFNNCCKMFSERMRAANTMIAELEK
jgi:hypothetical protein